MKYDFNEVIVRKGSEKWEYDSVIDGYKVIPMSVADTDLVSPIEVKEALINVCTRGEFGYPAYHEDFKDVLAAWYDRYYGWKPSTDDIIETPPLLMTMGAYIRGKTEVTDKVIIMTPVYHSFARTIRENHRDVVECDLIKDDENNYTIDFNKLDQLCSAAENKFLIFCNPHNPIGRCWTKEEVKKVVDIAQAHGVTLISDEIHADFVYDEKVYTPVLHVADKPDGIITFSSGGKLFNIGGIFSSYVFTSDPEIKKQIGIVLKELHFQPTAFAHEAAYAGYKYGHSYRQQVVEHIRKMQIKLVDGLNNMPYPVKANLPESTYLVWADFSNTGWSADEIQDFLVKEAGLGFNRGDQFGESGAKFARINCGVPESRIDEALMRLEKAFNKKLS
ncbi:MalY/PatB family protein [Vibrio sp. 10N.261.52.C2]|uniref:MalY/PatB family protein n=1 Tax=unclassified Vibrio TaxID=2614977 RepID=UPI0035537B67